MTSPPGNLADVEAAALAQRHGFRARPVAQDRLLHRGGVARLQARIDAFVARRRAGAGRGIGLRRGFGRVAGAGIRRVASGAASASLASRAASARRRLMSASCFCRSSSICDRRWRRSASCWRSRSVRSTCSWRRFSSCSRSRVSCGDGLRDDRVPGRCVSGTGTRSCACAAAAPAILRHRFGLGLRRGAASSSTGSAAPARVAPAPARGVAQGALHRRRQRVRIDQLGLDHRPGRRQRRAAARPPQADEGDGEDQHVQRQRSTAAPACCRRGFPSPLRVSAAGSSGRPSARRRVCSSTIAS